MAQKNPKVAPAQPRDRMSSPMVLGRSSPPANVVRDTRDVVQVAPLIESGAGRQGGDTCATAFNISAVPFSDSGTTAGATDDYNAVCPYSNSAADVVYAFTPTAPISVDISLCGNTAFDSKLYVFADSCASSAFACNEDACSTPAFPDPYVSALYSVSMLPGHTYYIVVDGYDSSQFGAYTIDVTESVPVPTCAANSLFGQSPSGPAEAWNFGVADTDWDASDPPGTDGIHRYDNFSGVSNRICDVTWWGITATPGMGGYDPCTENPMQFTIELFADAFGTPAASPAFSYTASVTATPTGVIFNGREMYQFAVNLAGAPGGCPLLTEGWISITGTGGDASCWFLWAGETPTEPNDGHLRNDTNDEPWIEEEFDLAFCLGGPEGELFGACCDEGSSGCSTGSTLANCLGEAQRFIPDQPGDPATCDDFTPACGQAVGACCRTNDTCDITTPSACTDGLWLGYDTTCDQCPCMATCPAGGIPENEPCGMRLNNGCNMDDPAFETIALGQTVCGMVYQNGEERDSDWYRVVITENMRLTWTVEAEFEVLAGPMEQELMGVPDCDNTLGAVEPYVIADPCETRSVTSPCFPAGTYYFFIAATWNEEVECPNHYWATLTGVPGCTVPTGSCCTQREECFEGITEDECHIREGLQWNRNGLCSDMDCTIPNGACCLRDGTCIPDSDLFWCLEQNPTQWSEGASCEDTHCAGPQPNETCELVEVISAVPYSTIFDSTLAAASAPSCDPSFTTTQNDVWWSYTPTSDCYMIITADDSIGFTYDMTAAVYSGPDCNNLTNLQCVDFPEPIAVEMAVTAGTTYWIQMGAWGEFGGGGRTQFDVTCGPTPTGACCLGEACLAEKTVDQCTLEGGKWYRGKACGDVNCGTNDQCAGATCVGAGTYYGNTDFANGEDVTSCTPNDSVDVWFQYTPTLSGDVVIDTMGSTFDTSVAAFAGCGGAELACNDDFNSAQSFIILDAVAGEPILIRIAGYDGASGDYTLNISGGEGTCACGDSDGDGDVDAVDYQQFIASFGRCVGGIGYDPDADHDHDGCVTFVDYQTWLQCYRSFVGNPLASPPTGKNPLQMTTRKGQASPAHGQMEMQELQRQ
jgi:hypothetical protein